MGSSTPECVCVTPMWMEQGKCSCGWGGEVEVHVFACAPGLDRPSPEPWNPSVYVGRVCQPLGVALAMGAYQCARWEGTSDDGN